MQQSMYASAPPKLFRHFLEHIPFAAAMVDREMRYLAISRQWLQVHGLEDQDIIGRKFPGERSDETRVNFATEGMKLMSHPWRDETGEVGGTIFSLVPSDGSCASNNGSLETDESDSIADNNTIFKATFEQAAVGIAHVGIEGRFLRLNSKFCEIVGYPEEELISLNLSEVTHPEDVGTDDEWIRQMLAGEVVTFSLEKRYIHQDGSAIWVKSNVSLVRESTGTPKYFICVIEDIGDRKAVEAQLRQSEADLKGALKLAAVGNWGLDIATETMTGSDETFRIFGLESMGTCPTYWQLRQQIHPEDVEIWESHVRKAIAEGTAYELEHRILDRDGTIRYVCSKGQPDRGSRMRLFGIAIDITERKTAELALQSNHEQLQCCVEERTVQLQETIAQLQQSDRRYRTVTEVSPVGIFHTDAAGNCLYVNDRWSDITGLTQEESLGNGWIQAIHPDDRSSVFERWRRSLQENKILASEYRLVRSNGKVTWILSQAVADRDETGKIIGYVGALTDISDYKRVQRALKQERNLFVGGPVIIFRWQAAENWPVEYVSPNVTQFGYQPSDFTTGKVPFASIVHPADLERVANEVQSYSQTEVTGFEQEYRIQTGDGRIVWIYDYTTLVRNEGGEITHFQGYILDITERKKTEEHLLRISKAIESTGDTIAIADADGTPIYQNPAFSQLYEYETVEDFNAAGGIPAVFPDKAVAMEMLDTIMSGKSWSRELTVRSRTGHCFDVLGRADAIKDLTGEIIGLIGISTDLTERKALEKELAQQQVLLNTFVTNAPVGIAILDPEFHYLEINENLAELNGLPVADHLGKKMQDIFPKLAANLEPVFKRILSTGQPIFNIELNGYSPKNPGILRTMLASYIPLRGEDNTPVAIGIIMVDISDRKRTEAELRQQAQILDQLCDAVITTDLEGNVTRWNKGAERIYGYMAAEVIGRSITCLYPPESQEFFQQQILPILQQKGNYEGELKISRKTGELIEVYISISMERDSHGQAIGLIGYNIDITERKKEERERRATAQKLSLLVQQTPLAVIEWNTQMTITAWNQAAERIFGYSASEAIGRNGFELLVPENFKEQLGQFTQELLSQQCHHYHSINENLTKDGQTIICEWYNNPLVDDRGEVMGLASLALDITERVQAERALRESEAKFRHLARQEELINQLTSQIRQSLDLDRILQTAVNQIRDLLNIDRCNFAWYRSGANPPVWEVVREAKGPDFYSQIGVYPATAIGSLVVEKVLAAEELRVENAAIVDDPVLQDFLSGIGTLSILNIPIHTRSGEMGVIVCMSCSNARVWHDNEVELLQAVATQLEIAIDQARLYDEAAISAATAQAKTQELETTLRELQQTQTQLIQSEKLSSLGQLVAGVAHEINNPVSFIYGNITPAQDYVGELLNVLELYQEAYPQPPEHIEEVIQNIDLEFLIEDLPKVLSSMKVGADRIQEIVRSLRTFSRHDEAQMKAVNIHEGIDSTLMILNTRLKAKPDFPAIAVIEDYGKLPLVECYPGQLNQVFMNILGNAIDALEEHSAVMSSPQKRGQNSESIIHNSNSSMVHFGASPSIRISTSQIGSDRVEIRIGDNGCGIPESVRQKLFEPFFTTKPVGKGTGLGLAISYQIVVEKHQGSLQCVSEIGKGTEFIIQIPVVQSPTK